MEDVARSLCFRKEPCGHSVCMDCLVNHLTNRIDDGSTLITCPVECTEEMQQHEIEKYVSSELFERYDRQGIQFMPDTVLFNLLTSFVIIP